MAHGLFNRRVVKRKDQAVFNGDIFFGNQAGRIHVDSISNKSRNGGQFDLKMIVGKLRMC